MLRAQWNHDKGATHYRCELHSGEGDLLLREYPDMMQNFCEFGGLEPDFVLDAGGDEINKVRHRDTLNADDNWTWTPSSGREFPTVGGLILEVVPSPGG